MNTPPDESATERRSARPLLPLAVFVMVTAGILGSWFVLREPPPSPADRPTPTKTPIPYRERCNDKWAVYGDFDGDKKLDRAYDVQADGSKVGVCLATGQQSEIPGSEGTVFAILDIEPDGRDEVFYGGTSASSAGGTVATVIDGKYLRDVIMEGTGYSLHLDSGHGSDGIRMAYETWGCRDIDRDGVREVNRGRVVHIYDEDEKVWRRTGPWKVFSYHLEQGANNVVAFLIDLKQGNGVVDMKRLVGASCESPRGQLVHPENG